MKTILPSHFYIYASAHPQAWDEIHDAWIDHVRFGSGQVVRCESGAAPLLVIAFSHNGEAAERRFDPQALNGAYFTLMVVDEALASRVEEHAHKQGSEKTHHPDQDIRGEGAVDSDRFVRFAQNNFMLWKLLDGAGVYHRKYGLGTVARVEKSVYPRVWMRFGDRQFSCMSYQFHKEVALLSLSQETHQAILRYEQDHNLISQNKKEFQQALAEGMAVEERRRREIEATLARQKSAEEARVRREREEKRRQSRARLLEQVRQYNQTHAEKMVLCRFCASPVREDRMEEHEHERCPRNPQGTGWRRSAAAKTKAKQKKRKSHLLAWSNRWHKSGGGKIQQTSIKTLSVGRRRGAVLHRKSY